MNERSIDTHAEHITAAVHVDHAALCVRGAALAEMGVRLVRQLRKDAAKTTTLCVSKVLSAQGAQYRKTRTEDGGPLGHAARCARTSSQCGARRGTAGTAVRRAVSQTRGARAHIEGQYDACRYSEVVGIAHAEPHTMHERRLMRTVWLCGNLATYLSLANAR